MKEVTENFENYIPLEMKSIKDLLKDWNFDKRNGLYRDVFAKWENKQIDMITEESAECVEILAWFMKLIAKLKRDNKGNRPLHYLEVLQAFKFNAQRIMELRDELADTIIIFDQFFPQFLELTLSQVDFKLRRLQGRVLKK